jgi:hypothetical protein
MYTNELLEEKYKTQKKLYVEAKNNQVDYLKYIKSKVKALFDEKSWKLQYSKREGGYLKSESV